MLYVFLGTDSEKRRTMRDRLAQKLSKGESVIFHDETTATALELEELLSAATLFGEPIVVSLEGVLASPEVEAYIMKHASDMSESKNHFIISETTLLKAGRTKLEKYAESLEEFLLKKDEAKKPAFNTFALTDAFAERDKKKTWILYREAMKAGIDPREITGVLFWMIKALILSKKTKSAEEAGLNPFVFKKAQRFAVAFKDEELASLSAQLVDVYHKGQTGEIEFEEGLEGYLLKAV